MVSIKKFIRINERIRAKEVRLIDHEGKQLGVFPVFKANELAKTNELDLVEVAPEAKPPVCKIMDFSKYKYEEEKKERHAKKHQHQTQLKEIRLRPHIEEHDYQVKLKQLDNFLKLKHKIKVSMRFRGREMAHVELGKDIIDRMIKDIGDKGLIEKPPSFEGRIINMVVGPSK